MTITTADLIARFGVNTVDVARWVGAGILEPVDGGGRGRPYEFDELDANIVAVLVEWRSATAHCSVHRLIADAARRQLADNPTAPVVVALADDVIATIGGERWT